MASSKLSRRLLKLNSAAANDSMFVVMKNGETKNSQEIKRTLYMYIVYICTYEPIGTVLTTVSQKSYSHVRFGIDYKK